MRKSVFILFAAILLVQCVTSSRSLLKDGVYEGRSCSVYTSESYVGITRVTIKKGKVQKVDFQIIDTLKNELFDANYDSHFPDNEVYRDQCHKDWRGVQHYPSRLIEKQNLQDVDAVTGATWSYNLFVGSAGKALKQAEAKTDSVTHK
jgi:major membrane immunogen (membrane-anchored lipoprotein)